MPSFHYKAIDQLGRRIKGRINANSESELETRLKQIGLDLITSRIASNSGRLFPASSVTLKELLMYFLQLEQMERGALPLLESLAELRDSATNPRLREVSAAMISDIEGGSLLSEAMAQHPQIFKPVFASLIRAGEKTGKLAEVFANLSAMLAWQDDLATQARKLLVYPLFVLVVVLGTAGFLMAYLLPQMTGFLINMGQEIPWETRLLLNLSEAISSYWWLIVGVLFVFAASIALLIKSSPAAQYRFDYIKLHLPGIGTVLQKIVMARFARYFSLMYRTGIPILDALRACQDIVVNRVVAENLERAAQQISGGAVMSESFRILGLFPPLVVRMIRLGERTGGLDEAMRNVCHFYDKDVKDTVDRVLQVIEPAMTVVLGAMLAVVMYAVLSPVYDGLTRLRF